MEWKSGGLMLDFVGLLTTENRWFNKDRSEGCAVSVAGRRFCRKVWEQGWSPALTPLCAVPKHYHTVTLPPRCSGSLTWKWCCSLRDFWPAARLHCWIHSKHLCGGTLVIICLKIQHCHFCVVFWRAVAANFTNILNTLWHALLGLDGYWENQLALRWLQCLPALAPPVLCVWNSQARCWRSGKG